MSGIDGLWDELAVRIADIVARRLSEGEVGLVDQANSPLGGRSHRAAVQRRIREGKPGASIVGRRHFLTREALQEELERRTQARDEVKGIVKAPRTETAADRLRQDLRMLKGRG
jgi:hypothetical protein